MKLDASASPVPTSPGSNADGIMSSAVPGEREARRFEWTATDPNTAEGRRRSDVHRLHVVHGDVVLFVGEVGQEVSRENSAEISFLSETELMIKLN